MLRFEGREEEQALAETRLYREEESRIPHSESEREKYWTACYAAPFDRRGTLLASGHALAKVPIHDILGLTVSVL